jgi:hypothetical protein
MYQGIETDNLDECLFRAVLVRCQKQQEKWKQFHLDKKYTQLSELELTNYFFPQDYMYISEKKDEIYVRLGSFWLIELLSLSLFGKF